MSVSANRHIVGIKACSTGIDPLQHCNPSLHQSLRQADFPDYKINQTSTNSMRKQYIKNLFSVLLAMMATKVPWIISLTAPDENEPRSTRTTAHALHGRRIARESRLAGVVPLAGLGIPGKFRLKPPLVA